MTESRTLIRTRESISRKHKADGRRFRKLKTMFPVIIFCVGLFLLLYPSVSDYWNSFHQSRTIASYANRVAGMNTEEYEEMIGAAREYNARIAQSGRIWSMTEERRAEYDALLKTDQSGIMGYIDIPKINVHLPFFHGTSDVVLQNAIGHMEQTSLPVGGPGTHSVLSGHRGLAKAKIFARLDRVTEGDTFTLSVLNETYTYEVDQIRVVLPSDMSEVRISPGKDLCTLVTCTPYGINTHRLLVRGHRIKNADGEAQVTADALLIEPAFTAPFIMAPMVVLLILLLITATGKH